MKLNTLENAFSSLRGEGKGAFMPYVCLGDFGVAFTEKLVEALCENGADIIELGIPFSDPVADGPTIQAAAVRALNCGTTPLHAFELVSRLRKNGNITPIVLMTYYNIVFRMGVEKFCKKACDAGANAVLCPDVPLEESGELRAACEKNGLDCIFLVAPNTPDARLKKILLHATGFLYLVSVAGTTGARKDVSQEALELVRRVKKFSGIPVAVGFGVSSAEHAMQLKRAGADGAIVGSKIIDLYSKELLEAYANGRENGKAEKAEMRALKKAAEFAREVKAALS